MALGRGLGSLIPNFRDSKPTTMPADDFVPIKKDLSGSKDKIWQIPVSLVKANSYQPRQTFNHQDLEDLVGSVKEHGVLQPILVTEAPDGSYELVAGERRLRASKIAGLVTIPAIVREIKGSAKLEMALIENIQRQDLNALEEGFAYERLIKEFGLTQEEVAKKVGKSRPHVGNTLRLLNLPEEIKEALIGGVINYSSARALVGLEDPKEQIKLFHKLTGEKMKGSEVEEAVSVDHAKAGLSRRDPLVMDYERRLRDALGTKVKVTQKGQKGNIIIEYYSDEELQRLVNALLK